LRFFTQSKASEGRHYKTVENLPWAINVASTYDYTIESVMITNTYLKSYLLFIDLKIIAKLTSYTRGVFIFALLKWSKYVRL